MHQIHALTLCFDMHLIRNAFGARSKSSKTGAGTGRRNHTPGKSSNCIAGQLMSEPLLILRHALPSEYAISAPVPESVTKIIAPAPWLAAEGRVATE